MSPSRDDSIGFDNPLVNSVEDPRGCQEVILPLRPVTLGNKQSPETRPYSPTPCNNQGWRYRHLDPASETLTAKKHKRIPNSSNYLHVFSITTKSPDTPPTGSPMKLPPFHKKPRLYFTKEQREWLTNYHSTMPDNTENSWEKASIAYKTAWGHLHDGRALQEKCLKMGLGEFTGRSGGGLLAVEMNAKELCNADATKPHETPLVRETAEAYQILTSPSSPQIIRNGELWLKDNIHKFQRSRSEVDWESLTDLFNDIFDMKKSPSALEIMWDRAVHKNCGLIRSV